MSLVRASLPFGRGKHRSAVCDEQVNVMPETATWKAMTVTFLQHIYHKRPHGRAVFQMLNLLAERHHTKSSDSICLSPNHVSRSSKKQSETPVPFLDRRFNSTSSARPAQRSRSASSSSGFRPGVARSRKPASYRSHTNCTAAMTVAEMTESPGYECYESGGSSAGLGLLVVKPGRVAPTARPGALQFRCASHCQIKFHLERP